MKDLKNDFKINQFKQVYLLYGEEPYLVRHYSNLFTEQLLVDTIMNRVVFEGKDFEIEAAIDAANTLPFLSEWRLVYIKDSQLLAPGRKDDTEALTKYLPEIPETTIMIFIETAVDKRNRLYKQISTQGRVVECKIPSEADLIRWVTNIFKKKKKEIHPQTTRLLLSTVPKGMDSIYAEADKLGDFVGDRTIITPEDIQDVCTKSLEARIFDLVGALCNGQTEKALKQYHNMLSMKEQPLMILTMMARQFRMILQCKACAEKRMMQPEIVATLGLRDFMVRECLRQGKHFTERRLLEALSDCQDTDIRIKTGLMGGELGVELLIVRYSI
ncbi:MAG: DNA polymerase III subunit delta [Defluviitaleaceae bacterium]|nr:DNA polymerase III subunit delta [Defluviitaleaceae bacterium]